MAINKKGCRPAKEHHVPIENYGLTFEKAYKMAKTNPKRLYKTARRGSLGNFPFRAAASRANGGYCAGYQVIIITNKAGTNPAHIYKCCWGFRRNHHGKDGVRIGQYTQAMGLAAQKDRKRK